MGLSRSEGPDTITRRHSLVVLSEREQQLELSNVVPLMLASQQQQQQRQQLLKAFEQ